MNNKVLIIDEEKWFANVIFDRIDKEIGPNRYDYAKNGSIGLSLLEQNSYNLIILDLMLTLGPNLKLPENEEIRGIYVLKKIREMGVETPIVCYTVLNEDYIIKQITDLGAFHICKLENNSFNNLFKLISQNLK